MINSTQTRVFSMDSVASRLCSGIIGQEDTQLWPTEMVKEEGLKSLNPPSPRIKLPTQI